MQRLLPPAAAALKPLQVIQLNQLEMLYGKHLVVEATYSIPPTHMRHMTPHATPFSYLSAALSSFFLSVTPPSHIACFPTSAAKKTSFATIRSTRACLKTMSRPPPPASPPATLQPAIIHPQPTPQVAFFDAFMSIFAPDDVGIWAKASAAHHHQRQIACCSRDRNARAGQAPHHSRHPAARRHQLVCTRASGEFASLPRPLSSSSPHTHTHQTTNSSSFFSFQFVTMKDCCHMGAGVFVWSRVSASASLFWFFLRLI
jgi:hypothetical protein